MRDASLLIRSIGDAPLTVEKLNGNLIGLWTIWLLADESLRKPFQVVPKIRVNVETSSDRSAFSEINCEDHLLLTFLSQKLIGRGSENKKVLGNLPNPRELIRFTLLPLHLVAH